MDTNRWWKWRQHIMYTIGFAAELQVGNQFAITRTITATQKKTFCSQWTVTEIDIQSLYLKRTKRLIERRSHCGGFRCRMPRPVKLRFHQLMEFRKSSNKVICSRFAS